VKLVIVESPSKGKTIQKYLGSGFKVMASGGHICDLPERTLGIDVGNEFKPEYVVATAKKKLLADLKSAVKDSESAFLATDPDREGEAISWHLATLLGLKGASRIEFNEISSKAVQRAIKSPREINMNLVDAQQARRVLDRLVGYKVSPIISKSIKPGLSGGRVQSAALKMVVDREREIRAFVPEEYWSLYALLNKLSNKKLTLKALFHDINGKKTKVENKEQADAILSALKTADWIVENVKRGRSKTSPAPPFMTSTMQQDGSQKLGIPATEIMKIAQQLYEGVDIAGEGHIAFVTYIRTDSIRVSAEMQKESLEYIKAKYGQDYAPEKPNFYASKSQNTQDAHEAVRPISLERTPESVKDKLSKNQYRLYKLIYDRFIASQMTDAVYDTLNVRIEARAGSGEKFGFKLSGRSVVFKGYTVVYESAEVREEDELQSNLPDLNEGEKLTLQELKPEQKFTKPPSRYSEATLIKAMEENGIGRPSTYASVLAVFAKREYTEKEQKLMKPTALGESVNDFMELYFANIVDSHFTAEMEERLDKIEHQGIRWQDVLGDFWPSFQTELQKAYAENKQRAPKVEEESEVVCDKCGKKMVFRDGKYGKFLACPGYPACKNVKNIDEHLGTCPKCGKDIHKCYSKAGKMFYGCNGYPDCKFMSWDIPAPIMCPHCVSVMKIVEEGGEKAYLCTNKNCKEVVKLPKA